MTEKDVMLEILERNGFDIEKPAKAWWNKYGTN